MRHYPFQLSLLVGCAAAAVLSAQQLPQSAPSAADPIPAARERHNVNDAHLGLEVQARLSQELGVSNLSALVHDGVATLDGIVHSDSDRQRAEQLALDVEGVDSVVNELSVATPTIIALANEAAAIATRESTDLETAVTQHLRSDATIGSRPISVEADELTNTVTLTGTVATPEEKERAGQLAVEAFPAGQVRNQLEVQQRL